MLPRKEELALVVARKFFVGHIMSTLKVSPEFLAQLRELAVQWGKTAAQRVSAEAGSAPLITFAAIEEFAALIAAGVTEGSVATLLDKQAQTLTDAHPCPKCQTQCPVKYRDRPLTLETGQLVALHEPICHCPKCKRDFFPPTEFAATRRAQV